MAMNESGVHGGWVTRLWLAIVGHLVPHTRRAGWRREWQAELAAARQNGRGTFRIAVGFKTEYTATLIGCDNRLFRRIGIQQNSRQLDDRSLNWTSFVVGNGNFQIDAARVALRIRIEWRNEVVVHSIRVQFTRPLRESGVD
jgi:hypothetical protein